MKSEDLYYDFLLNHFPIKRVKNKNGKWKRTIIIEGGILTKNNKSFDWSKEINKQIVAAEFILTLKAVFACTNNEAWPIVQKYLDKFTL